MPTTITSAGITFNDNTSQTTAANLTTLAGTVGTSQIANNAVTAAKLGTNEQKQICKAWVNFDGTTMQSSNAVSSLNLNCTAGSNVGTWVSPTTWTTNWVGQIIYITSIGGVSNATFGGLNVATVGFQITSVSGTTANVKFLAGNAASTQTINGNGASSGYTLVTYGIRSSYNVSSITKIAAGTYTVNFATPMADTNYVITGTASISSASQAYPLNAGGGSTTTGATVGHYEGGVGVDSTYVLVAIFGN